MQNVEKDQDICIYNTLHYITLHINQFWCCQGQESVEEELKLSRMDSSASCWRLRPWSKICFQNRFTVTLSKTMVRNTGPTKKHQSLGWKQEVLSAQVFKRWPYRKTASCPCVICDATPRDIAPLQFLQPKCHKRHAGKSDNAYMLQKDVKT